MTKRKFAHAHIDSFDLARHPRSLNKVFALRSVDKDIFKTANTLSRLYRTFTLLALSECHYENMSMQYTAIFHGSKNEKF